MQAKRHIPGGRSVDGPMGVRFLCPNGHKLHVKSFLSGKRGICPQCDARFIVPTESGTQATFDEDVTGGDSAEVAEPVALTGVNALPAADQVPVPDLWYVRSPDGQQYGPADSSLMKTWVSEGRVAADSWVWHSGWPEWKKADVAMAELSVVMPQPSTDFLPPANLPVEEAGPRIESEQVSPQSVISNKKSRRERATLITFALGALVLLLLVAVVLVVSR